ncbi:MAG TPA: hypothetical protein VIY86_03985, partial [Pirellulaceae bacterium]
MGSSRAAPVDEFGAPTARVFSACRSQELGDIARADSFTVPPLDDVLIPGLLLLPIGVDVFLAPGGSSDWIRLTASFGRSWLDMRHGPGAIGSCLRQRRRGDSSGSWAALDDSRLRSPRMARALAATIGDHFPAAF